MPVKNPNIKFYSIKTSFSKDGWWRKLNDKVLDDHYVYIIPTGPPKHLWTRAQIGCWDIKSIVYHMRTIYYAYLLSLSLALNLVKLFLDRLGQRPSTKLRSIGRQITGRFCWNYDVVHFSFSKIHPIRNRQLPVTHIWLVMLQMNYVITNSVKTVWYLLLLKIIKI